MREGLPATDGDVDEQRFELKRTGMPSNLLSRHDRAAPAGKDVEDDVALARAVLDGIGDERDRLWMRPKLVHAMERVHARIVPDV